MIDRAHDLPVIKAGGSPEHQPWQCLLSTTSSVGDRPGGYATSRPAASGGFFRRFADVVRPAGGLRGTRSAVVTLGG